MKHYLMIDKHNHNKAHHIKIDDDGLLFYNQAIRNERHADRETIPGYPGWYDFYKVDEEVEAFGGHGYQAYINKAWRQYLSEQPLKYGDTFYHYFNQADREVEVLAVVNGEALGYYEMPRGRKFLCIHDAETKSWKRTQAVKTLPKRWINALSKTDYGFILSEVG